MLGERSSRTGDVGDPDITELNRRVANLIRIGTIAEADYGRALARVRIGDLTTDWRPWLAPRVGGDIAWWAPEVGEQVILFSPSGELTLGVILAGIYQQAKPAPADRETVHRTVYQDGAVVEYDRAAHRLKIDLSACSGTIELRTGSSEILLTPTNLFLRADRIDINQ
jgi:phage baseplate assembly protein V